MTDCKCKDSTGWTTVKCCNLCGKSVEEFWKVDDAKDKEIQSLTEQLEAKDDEMNGLIEIHHEQCKELELEIQSLKEQLQKAEEKLKQYNQNEV